MPGLFKNYMYFDTPDGENIPRKLYAANRLAIPAAIGVSMVDVLMYSHPKTYWGTLSRFGLFCVPILGVTNIIVLTTNFLANYRQKDDKLNWALGGVAAGMFYGAFRRSGTIAVSTSVLLAAGCAIKKYHVENDYTMVDFDVPLRTGTIRSTQHDFTLIANRPGNWTTGK